MQTANKPKLYKRHTPACPVLGGKNMTPAKAALILDACSCPIWITGRTPNGSLIPRESLKTSDLIEAKRKVQAFIAASQATDTAIAANGLPIREAVRIYLLGRADDLASASHSMTTMNLAKLVEYTSARNIAYCSELTTDVLERFKAESLQGLKTSTKSNILAAIKCFLREAFRRDWIKIDLAGKVRAITIVRTQTQPFTSAECACLIAGAGKLVPDPSSNVSYSSYPETLQTLLMLMLETGLRVSDAVRFDPSKVKQGKVCWKYTFRPLKQVRTRKAKEVTVFLPSWLKARIDSCKGLSSALPFWFGPATENNGYNLTHSVYYRMQAIGKACGIEDCRPHRFRDTFAVNQLIAGTSMDDVSKLLGHSSIKITETYYASWVPAREDRLEALVASTHQEPLYC